ncbi:MAG: PAS domain-containing protein [Thermoleophilia bacterium]
MKELRAALACGNTTGAITAARQLATISDEMVYKEEKVLFPLAMEALANAEWAAIRTGEVSIGYALIAAPPAWPPISSSTPGQPQGEPGEGSLTFASDIAVASAASSSDNAAREGADLLSLNVGALSVDQLKLLLAALPLDYSFVDEHDTVLFYSEGDRIFPRSPGVIGRQVQNCHPPASVHKVQQIVDSFRAGEKDVAEFWLAINERFLHIRYFACRDAAGVYRGVVETVQDVTEFRALTGQRRLLDW